MVRFRTDNMRTQITLLLSTLCYVTFAADDVLVFTDSNFENEVAKHPVILLEFYAPW